MICARRPRRPASERASFSLDTLIGSTPEPRPELRWWPPRRSSGRRSWHRRHDIGRAGGYRFVSARIEPEWRVDIGHQGGVGGDAEDPAVHPEHKVIERLRVA